MATGTELTLCFPQCVDIVATPMRLSRTTCTYCEELIDLRESLCPPNLTLENCLFNDTNQLMKTSQYHMVASRIEQV